MTKRTTKEEFVTRANAVHINKYTYHNVEYVKMSQKVCITCPTHGDFLQEPSDHLKKHGCPKCKADKRSFTWPEMFNQFPEKNKTYYTYDETTYRRSGVKMRMICPKHGEFWQKPEIHKNGSGCRICNASGGPGKYCETLFDRRPELKQTPGFLYFIELFDSDNTKFYKIGITTSLKTRFYNYVENNRGRIIWVKADLLYNCFLLEQKILEKNSNIAYRPVNLCIGGKTECFTKEILNDY
ncbi:MAG: GIY-YIG nuclease family protein [Proteobacteria bacterium]|nr:GIY-YIG nuclease family protein [Pseudomonadota bacterium]